MTSQSSRSSQRKTTIAERLSNRSVATVLAVLLLAATLAGCSSTQPASASFASVEIPNRTPEEIRNATIRVFQEGGYRGYASPSGSLTFDKEASRATTLSRSGLYAAQQGAVTVERVKVETVALGAASHRLQAQAFMVLNAGDSFFEEEQRLANIRSAPYQRLLNEVANRLK